LQLGFLRPSNTSHSGRPDDYLAIYDPF
jgi:hypothetical protein